MTNTPIKIAIIDMYDDTVNLGMICILGILKDWSQQRNILIEYEIFPLRNKCKIPDNSFDIYLSTGGPGSPIDSEGSTWDNLFVQWLQKMLDQNKPVLLICHSFQIACRHFNFGNVCLRKSTQLGVLPVHPLVEDKIFQNLNDPFYTLESRVYQIIEPNDENIASLGAKIIALEKHRPHVPLERAIMAIKFSDKMYGVQFHPEGEKNILIDFFNDIEVKNNIIEKYGEQKWEIIMSKLNDPEKLPKTHAHFIPNFLNLAIGNC
jgi:homoserine O-succinyltransferase